MACRRFGTTCTRLRKNLLLILIVCGAVLGFILGAAFNGPVNEIINPEDRKTAVMLIGFAGEMFMDMLQMVVIPLIVSSLVLALANLDRKATGKIGRRVLAYYLTTTVIAATLGLVLVLSIRPGSTGKASRVNEVTNTPLRILDSFLDLLRNCFPSNLIQAAFAQRRTKYTSVQAKYEIYNQTIDTAKLPINETITIINNGTHNITTITRLIYPASDTVPAGVGINPRGGMNILGLIVFSLLFGAKLGTLGERGAVAKDFFWAVNEVIMKIVELFMCIVTLPTTMHCAENNNYVDKRISQFMLPLGATINMDGAALHMTVMTVFVAQLNNIPTTPAFLVTTILSGTAVSIGAAGIPAGGPVILIMVLQAVNLPLEDIGLIIAVIWIVDRVGTPLNIWGDSMGAGIIDHLLRDDMKALDELKEDNDHYNDKESSSENDLPIDESTSGSGILNGGVPDTLFPVSTL